MALTSDRNVTDTSRLAPQFATVAALAPAEQHQHHAHAGQPHIEQGLAADDVDESDGREHEQGPTPATSAPGIPGRSSSRQELPSLSEMLRRSRSSYRKHRGRDRIGSLSWVTAR